MLGFLTAGRDAGPLLDEAAADEFWQLLPRSDPFSAQHSVSEALAEFTTRAHPGRDHIRALLTLDQRAGRLGDDLLWNYTNERVPSPSMERKSWLAALAFSQSFARAHTYVLWHIASAAPAHGLSEYAPAVLLRFFQHRQVEFLLHSLRSEPPAPDRWVAVHWAYKYALAQGLLQQHAVVTRSHELRRSISTLEREYIHILLLEMLNRGQVSPYDAFFVNRMLPRWCATLSLRASDALRSRDRTEDFLVVDTERPEGLMRASVATTGPHLCLDPYPMLILINDEIAAVRNRVGSARTGSSSGHDRKLKLLRKISAIYSPKPPPVNRRGQRRPTASTVQAIVGLTHVIRMLRNERRRKAALAATAAMHAVAGYSPRIRDEDATIPLAVAGHADSPSAVVPNGEFGVPHQVWHLKDRSESGCRFRGEFGDANRVVPGALVAIREGADAPWILAVVRRRRTRIGDRVDIGVEFLGRSPHGVALASDEGDHPENQEAAKNQRNRFNALYLSESAQHPAMPFKTLVMAAREFSVGRRLKLESVGGTFTIRLKEPIEEQGDFAWLPYEVLDRRKAGESAPLQRADGKPIATLPTNASPRTVNSGEGADVVAADGKPIATLPTNASPRTVNSGEGADVVAPEPDKRVAGAGNT